MKCSPQPAATLLAAVLVAGTPAPSAADGPDPAASAAPTAPGTGARESAAPCPAEGHPRDPGWALSSPRIDPGDTNHAYVGNGYLGQRVPPGGAGYVGWGEDKKTGFPLYTPRYDGSLVSGLYANNPETAKNLQAIAALPNWSGLTVSTGGDTFTPTTPAARVSDYRQTLFLRCGLVRTSLTWTTAGGRATDLVYDVLTDRTDQHVGAVRLRMTPRWSGDATVTDLIDGRGARRIAQTGGGPRPGDRTVDVAFRTDGTRQNGAVASTLREGAGIGDSRDQQDSAAQKLTISQRMVFPVRAGRSYELTKYVGVDTDLTSGAPEKSAVAASQRAADRGWDALFEANAAAWDQLWRGDIEVPGQPELQAWVRSARYGLLTAARRGAANSLAPTGLSSDDYAGEVFWDAETWMFPSLLAFDPDLARTVVDYRYRTRTAARANAEKLGYPGLFYSWTSGADGALWKECHSWDPPHCRTQNHLQSDIALAVWQYYEATGDTAWLRTRGWPILKGIAEFWAGRVTAHADGSYSIDDVAGPDEYSNGVDDAVFTNAGAATALRNATRAAGLLGRQAPAEWTAIADRLRIPYDKEQQVFLQYAGYRGSLIKQADTVLLMYPLEWPMPRRAAASTLDYYAARTDPEGPAMTDSVHAIDAAAIGEPGCVTYTYLMRSIAPFVRGPFALFSESRGEKAGAEDPLAGSPAQDFITGKGGFLQVFVNGLAGLRWRADRLHLDPMLPPQLKDGVRLRGVRRQGRTLDIEVGPRTTTVRLTGGDPLELETPQGSRTLSRGAPAVVETRRPDLAPTDDLARCRTARADSEQPGGYAYAAVDGSPATAWVPDGASGSLTADLGSTVRVERIAPEWTAVRPSAYRLEVSADGRHWRTVETGKDGALSEPVRARYVRVVVRAADPGKPAGVRELRVE
ncbi:discoidin domain-containing protein [Streptomyces pathocidini]|uniref:Discoidin domain-containing protein n=1 Tax=Streptomyces pathocidini TaxID=1650571 RepID=A0ABW7UQS0_9ACTN|nr:discoidin domain-containing protein [Streptomyces pathocidini]